MKDVPAGLVADPEHPSRLQLHHIWKEVASPHRALCPRCASYDRQSVPAIRSISAAENGYSFRSHQRYHTPPRLRASPGRGALTGMHLTLGGERGLAVLTIDLYRSQAPVFFSRRVNCAHRLRNAWKRRTVSAGRSVSVSVWRIAEPARRHQDFSTDGQATRSRRYVLFGRDAELESVACLLCTLDRRLEALLRAGIANIDGTSVAQPAETAYVRGAFICALNPPSRAAQRPHRKSMGPVASSPARCSLSSPTTAWAPLCACPHVCPHVCVLGDPAFRATLRKRRV
jgi:hypothetical protein